MVVYVCKARCLASQSAAVLPLSIQIKVIKPSRWMVDDSTRKSPTGNSSKPHLHRAFKSGVFNSCQKMALRAFYFIRTLFKVLTYYYINRFQCHLLVAIENKWLEGPILVTFADAKSDKLFHNIKEIGRLAFEGFWINASVKHGSPKQLKYQIKCSSHIFWKGRTLQRVF